MSEYLVVGIFAGLCTAVPSIIATVITSRNATKDRSEGLKLEIADIKNDIKALQKEIADLRADFKDMSAKVSAHNNLSVRLEGLEHDISHIQHNLNKLERSAHG